MYIIGESLSEPHIDDAMFFVLFIYLYTAGRMNNSALLMVHAQQPRVFFVFLHLHIPFDIAV